ncbi:MAG TPA: hypothetical protein DCG34_04895, partial [Clostridiales bacterium]|nr:hypothetical protein [Clostridiales bacterium]
PKFLVCALDGSPVPRDAGETTESVPVSRSGTKVLSFRTIPKQTLGRKRLLGGSIPSAFWSVALI